MSETRILNLLHNAYSQNYSYLIKKPTDQYQVILEVQDNERSDPEDLHLLYIKSDDGARMVPLSAITTWHSVIGPQSVNHINQFTSVTLFFNLKPGYTIGQATNFVENAAKQILPPEVRGGLQGEALTFRDTVSSLTILMVAGRLRDVRDPGDSVRELHASRSPCSPPCRWRWSAGCSRCGSSARKLRSTPTSACSC